MEQINWDVDGMSCTNCALSIEKYLQEKGMENVKVNFIQRKVSFDKKEEMAAPELVKGLAGLGYTVINKEGQLKQKKRKFLFFNNHLQRFIFCGIFTLPLLASHMIPALHDSVLMNPYLQLCLAIPVYFVGMDFFGRSAFNSMRSGVLNMNVLIALGATAAFFYSLYGTLTGKGMDFMFYETATTILTLVFLGNYMEDRSMEVTQNALNKLARTQKSMANMIAYDDQHNENIFPIESSLLKTGDLILIKEGEPVPMDSKILWGDVLVNESIISGESLPVQKKMNDFLIGGSLIEQGTVKAYVTATGEDSVLGNILKLAGNAMAEKPPMQQLADKISAIFIPTVLLIALATLLGNYFFTSIGFGNSLLRSIAVLVIACPCAMGLATPAAIAVGMGRAARNGILFKNTRSLETFKDIKQVVFDKTGTLTTGKFKIRQYHFSQISEEQFKNIAYSLEKYSNHPIAKCIAMEWKINKALHFSSVKEIKGLGMEALSENGDTWKIGSFKIAPDVIMDNDHNLYLLRNNELIGWIDVMDDIRPEAGTVISFLKEKGIQAILLSGDTYKKCELVASQLNIDTVIAEQSPQEKLNKIADLSASMPTVMVGDGINDAPALAKATIGISLSEASQIAMQNAQVVLLNHGLAKLPIALGLGKHTYLTIKQNLFWAFLYNIIALPVAAFGYLSPTFGALVMGLSDVVLAINSVRLKWKKVT
ncbi:MAG: cadmium-translocating P-type ATPase [Bacteroidetes bacterium]|nr:cadmium-translocating P-type ATPase [Bacteroidota bacterium]